MAFLLLQLLLVPVVFSAAPVSAGPESRPAGVAELIDRQVFSRIITWQRELQQRMAAQVRQCKAGGGMAGLLPLLAAAFAYGVVHAAGPGHGKALALGYVLSQRPSYPRGLLFGFCLALFHGLSGIAFVLVVRFLLHAGVGRNLAAVTRITRIVGYGIISLMGLFICVRGLMRLRQGKNDDCGREAENVRVGGYRNPVLLALAVGGVPCPGVVMVMLFAMSMNLIGLGIVLGICIAAGMALTVSLVVLVAVSGKTVSLSALSGSARHPVIDYGFEIAAGLLLLILGTLFLGANVMQS
ncbi:MAG: hypothetical protein JW781_01210 [Deltaproteobacteria bacterium]|nr:hypothetical protein [Candidatus Anaeroferrophillacea bacterium]